MNVLKHIHRNYNYYPTTAIELSSISYDDQDKISSAVSANTNLKVVWGPAKHTHWDDITYSLMFVACNAETGEYFVVIRGTNDYSLSTFLKQDFDLGSTPPFSSLPDNPPNVPANAFISQGTFNGMSDLISLKEPVTGQSIVEFLRDQIKDQKLLYLYFTGHSLGGTLSPPLLAYINAMLYEGNSIGNMALWTFAGLTPGGTGFNDYFNSIIPNDQGFLWRIQNSLDIAPFLFSSQAHVENIYNFSPHYLKWSFLEKDLIEHWFKDANSSGIGYAQPQVGEVIPGQFDTNLPGKGDDSWILQVVHQHHPRTYKPMVNGKYPVKK